jgi:hypothetical protein
VLDSTDDDDQDMTSVSQQRKCRGKGKVCTRTRTHAPCACKLVYKHFVQAQSSEGSSQQHAGSSGKYGTTKPKKQVLILSILSLPSPPLPSPLNSSLSLPPSLLSSSLSSL